MDRAVTLMYLQGQAPQCGSGGCQILLRSILSCFPDTVPKQLLPPSDSKTLAAFKIGFGSVGIQLFVSGGKHRSAGC
jgi:hypothetical protein